MTLADFFFFVFSAVLIGSALMVVTAKNPVHSVLFLILAFVNAAGLFLLMGAEFLAMLLVVVYVGAVAVLFLFVVMMLDIDFAELRDRFLEYLPLGTLISICVLLELVVVVGGWATSGATAQPAAPVGAATNAHALGLVLYTRYAYFFQAAGMVLLTAMIGAIVLTLQHKPGVKRQNYAAQSARDPAEAVRLVRPASGRGLDEESSAS